jgi:hypothetical protein
VTLFRRRKDEAEQARAEQEVALGDALAEQQAKLDANLAENAAKQKVAQGIAYVQAALSDWMKRYLYLVATYPQRYQAWREAVARQPPISCAR